MEIKIKNLHLAPTVAVQEKAPQPKKEAPVKVEAPKIEPQKVEKIEKTPEKTQKIWKKWPECIKIIQKNDIFLAVNLKSAVAYEANDKIYIYCGDDFIFNSITDKKSLDAIIYAINAVSNATFTQNDVKISKRQDIDAENPIDEIIENIKE